MQYQLWFLYASEDHGGVMVMNTILNYSSLDGANYIYMDISNTFQIRNL